MVAAGDERLPVLSSPSYFKDEMALQAAKSHVEPFNSLAGGLCGGHEPDACFTNCFFRVNPRVVRCRT